MKDLQDMTPKRLDPNFAQVTGYVPKDLALEFKIVCTRKEITMADALAEAIQIWMKIQTESK